MTAVLLQQNCNKKAIKHDGGAGAFVSSGIFPFHGKDGICSAFFALDYRQ
ncbi:hypothetical protein [Anaerovibrio slackiae]